LPKLLTTNIMKAKLYYIQLEEKINRYITVENPLIFTYNGIEYRGYRKNGFIYITTNT
jgi:hypothetical protein